MNQPAGSMTTTVLIHRGAVRAANQDSLVVGCCVIPSPAASIRTECVIGVELEPAQVVAVADGLGGHAAGDVASAMTVHDLAAACQTGELDSTAQVARTLGRISDRIVVQAGANQAQRDMGTTVAGLVLSATSTITFNVGDSSILRYDGGYLAPIHVPDTPSGDVESGPSHLVTQFLGTHPAPHPHVFLEESRSDQTYLLCTDGLTDHVDLGSIERILQFAEDDKAAVSQMWAQAMAGGGADNITIVLVRVRRSPDLVDVPGQHRTGASPSITQPAR